MSTTSMIAIAQAIRAQLLAFTPMGGAPSLTTALGGRIWIEDAPDDAVFPYATLRVLQTSTGGCDGDIRRAIQVELHIYGRPASTRAAVRQAADVAVEALRRWLDDTGSVFLTGALAVPFPTFRPPADRELVAVRVTAEGYCYPSFLTQYAAQAS